MKNVIKITGLFCAAIILVAGFYKAIFPKTLDFRGTVTEIEITNEEITFKISTQSIGASYIVVADNKTKVQYCHKNDPKIDLSDVKIGDTFEGNYRWFSKNHKAKFVKVWCNDMNLE